MSITLAASSADASVAGNVKIGVPAITAGTGANGVGEVAR